MLSFETLLQISATSACLIAGLIIISMVMGNNLAAKYRRLIWWILALRLLFPFNINLPQAPVQVQTPDLAASVFPAHQQVLQQSVLNAGSSLPETERGISILQILFIAWLAGMVLMAVYEIVGYHYTRRKLLRWSRDAESSAQAALRELCAKLGISKPSLKMRRSKDVQSPMIIGLLSPVLLLPCDEYTTSDLNMILCHELMHHKRGDLWIKLAILVARIVHWFNPFVHIMARRAQTDMEFACDDAVVRAIGAEQNRAYSETIINTASAPRHYATALSTSFKSVKNNLEERIINIMNAKKRKSGAWIVAGAILVVLTGGLLVGFTAHASPYADSLTPDPASVSLEGKSDVYQLIAQLAQVDTNQSVDAYNAEIETLCEAAGTNIFSARTDADITDTADPLYNFMYGTLAHTASEIYAEKMGQGEDAYFSRTLSWERYLTADEHEARYRGDHNDEEWAGILEDIKNDEPAPIAVRYVDYYVTYELKDTANMTVADRERIFLEVSNDMQAWFDNQSEKALFADGFEAAFTSELDRVASKHTNKRISLNGIIGLIEGYDQYL